MTKYFTKDDDDNYVEVEALSKESVDGLIEYRLKRQRETQFGDYDELKQKASDAAKRSTDFEAKLKEATEKAETLSMELASSKLETTKVKLLSEFKLNDDMAEFISGDNEDEMRRRAEKLAEKAPKSSITITKKSDEGSKANDNRELARKLFGRSDD